MIKLSVETLITFRITGTPQDVHEVIMWVHDNTAYVKHSNPEVIGVSGGPMFSPPKHRVDVELLEADAVAFKLRWW